MQLRPALATEQTAIRRLLLANDLPVADLETAAVEFLVVIEDDQLLGVIGLEIFDATGLLRSLCVAPSARRLGLGAQLVQQLEALSRERGLRRLVLLTQTAAPFFARRGYREIARAAAPAEVLQSAEFRSICPASATCMSKSLSSKSPEPA